MNAAGKKRVTGPYRNWMYFGIGAAVVAFVCFLLFMNYRFAADLRTTSLNNMKEETEKRAASVGFFFADRRDDLMNLALSREISVFFENKALGMSMEYGLRLSLFPIKERFQELIHRRMLGKDAVYSRLMLIERDGTVLVDTLAAADRKAMRGRLKEFIVPKYRDGAILSLDGGKELAASLSYFFKDRYAGQIIAWIEPRTLYKNLLGEGESPDDISYLVGSGAGTFKPAGASLSSQISGMPDPGGMEPGKPFEFRSLDGETQSWIGLKTPVSGAPFYMLRFVASSNVVGGLTPKYLFTTTGLIAFVLLGSAGFAFLFVLRAEEAVRRSEATLRSVFKTTPIGLCIMKSRVFQNANKAWYESFGYAESDILGQTARSLYESEEEYERVGRALYANFSERGLASVETKICRKDGVFRDVILTAAPLQSEDFASGTIVAIDDITDYRRAMEELKENRRRLADIIEFLPDATLVIDREGRVIAWNRAMEIMTGVQKKDMIGKDDYEYALPLYGERRPLLIDFALHPDGKTGKHYTAIQRAGDVLFSEAFAPNLPNGDTHLSATASVLRDDRGEIIAAIECIRDNTERKKLEESLNRAQKMEALGTLAGGVAHDLNNVLGVMVGYSELLLEHLPEGSPQRRYADSILKSSVRGAAIIQDLLTLARRGVAVSEVIDLNKVVSDYLLAPECDKLKAYHPDVTIRTELEEGLLKIKGSPIHLNKVVMNLVSNAAEAISGPGEVTMRTENRYLDRPLQGYDKMEEGDYVVLSVSDTGGGISASDREKIFEPFYTKKVMGRSGTGLGLTVVWGTVKDHDGYIDVQSEEGKGSVFSLYFPVTREAFVQPDEKPSLSVYRGRGESILVVDDVQEQREMAMSMLNKLGYHVGAVAGGEAAVEYLKNQSADLVILDMVMDPGIDGFDTYSRILEIRPNQKALIVSGFSETDRVRKAQKMGAGAFVRKPYILENIGMAVRRELDRG